MKKSYSNNISTNNSDQNNKRDSFSPFLKNRTIAFQDTNKSVKITSDGLARTSLKDKICQTLRQNYSQQLKQILRLSNKTKRIQKKGILNNFSLLSPTKIKQLAKFNTTLSNNQTMKTIRLFLNSPKYSHNSIIKQLYCFMVHTSFANSSLFPQSKMSLVKDKLYQKSRNQQYKFKYIQLGKFITILQQGSDSQTILFNFNKFYQSYIYPTSIQLMIHYIWIYLASINGQYQVADNKCKRLLDIILRCKLDQYVPIYYILTYKLKTNQGMWLEALPYLSRLLSSSWLFQLRQLQNWCYFEFSRAHFSLGNGEQSRFFKIRSQKNVREDSNTILRDLMLKQYKNEIQMMRHNVFQINPNSIIQIHQLSRNPQQKKEQQPVRIQQYAKFFNKGYKIKYVKNIITRLVEQPSKGQVYAGNPKLMTHQSGIKNLNIYFRQKNRLGNQKLYFTCQDSDKNTLVVKQMIRLLLLQMKWYVPFTQ